MSDAVDEILLTDGEAARLLRILRTRLVRLARANKVPHVLLPDGEIRFRRADLIEWVAEFRQPAKRSPNAPKPETLAAFSLPEDAP